VTNTGNYDVNVDSAQIKGVCTNEPAFSLTIARDLASAWVLFHKAVVLLNLTDNQIIIQLEDDVATVADKVLVDSEPDDASQVLPQECLNLFSGAGITKASYQSYNGVFDPPSGC